MARRFRGKNESRRLPPWSQRRRGGSSPAVLEAPRRELIRQHQRSPAAHPVSAGGRRSLRGLLVIPSSRSPLVWQYPAAHCGATRSFRVRRELSSLRPRRKCLWNHHSSRGHRLRAAGRRPRASISRPRSLFFEARVFYTGFNEWHLHDGFVETARERVISHIAATPSRDSAATRNLQDGNGRIARNLETECRSP